MPKPTRLRPAGDLLGRQTLEIQLPRFLIRAFEHGVAEANDGAAEQERITIDHLIEIHLAEFVSIGEVAQLEREVPGIGAAVRQWLSEVDS